MIDNQILLTETTTTLGLRFWVPIIVTIVLAFWNLFQQMRLAELKKEKEKQLHVHRLQFEKEFEIYKELWAKLVELRDIVYILRPQFLDSADPGKTYKETLKSRLIKAEEISNDTIALIEKNKPFYAKQIYGVLFKVIKLIKLEFIEVEHSDSYTENNRAEDNKNLSELLEQIENVCEAIRERIGNLETK